MECVKTSGVKGHLPSDRETNTNWENPKNSKKTQDSKLKSKQIRVITSKNKIDMKSVMY